MKLIAYRKDDFGNEIYLKEDGNFTYNLDDAKVYEEKWWHRIVYMILEILLTWGFTVKMKRK